LIKRNHAVRNMMLVTAWALLAVFIVGYVMWRSTEPTKLDKECLSKPMRQISRCIQEFQDKMGASNVYSTSPDH